ncbi:MAG TPA: hypothetical protein VEQ58_17885 [Polyangiaceae bacterium]|nr:hypothetical protein [Polyangiaceae bacterium]
MTQNVKIGRGCSWLSRSWAALLWLALASTVTLLACGSDKSKDEPPPASSGRFTPCAADAQCDEAHGFSCVDRTCNYECQSHADCVAVGHCGSRDVDGERRHFCVFDDELPKRGELYSGCPNGNECAAGALCISAGAGDLDAYCTIDCSDDDGCAAGYYCGTLSAPPCEDACGFRGQPGDARCVPADQIGDGKPYQCGPSSIERRICRQREFCSECSTDDDCLAVPNQVCARDQGGEKICTQLCDPRARSCPWGNATQCAVFDEELGVATCSHKFGSCHGTGQTCEPCRGSADCPGGACLSSSFTGERWCVNLDTKCECKNGVDASGVCSDGGCPHSPSGLPLQCIGAIDSSLDNTCYAANSASESQLGTSPQTGCWGAN